MSNTSFFLNPVYFWLLQFKWDIGRDQNERLSEADYRNVIGDSVKRINSWVAANNKAGQGFSRPLHKLAVISKSSQRPADRLSPVSK